jgi:hypothetical protein
MISDDDDKAPGSAVPADAHKTPAMPKDRQFTDEEKAKLEEEQLDEGLEDSFPASDPPSITQPVHRRDEPGG